MGEYFQRYDAFLVDSDLDARMRLKQATTSVASFGRVNQASKLAECLDRIRGSEKTDVIFVSYQFDRASTVSFINEVKKHPNGQDAAFILVMQNKDQQSSTVAENILCGADGFLFAPYSVEQLVEITRLAAEVKRERSHGREEAALRFLLNDVIGQVDQLSMFQKCGYEAAPILKKLRDTCAVLRALEGDSLDLYFKLAAEVFETAPLPISLPSTKKYVGASSRVAKRMEKRAMMKLGL